MEKTYCCFTGHRRLERASVDALRTSLHIAICRLYENGVRGFMCGGALGFDMLAAEAVLHLKQTHPDICLALILPCRDQDKLWNARQKEAYHALLQRADLIRYITDTYRRGCMHLRNRFMVDHSAYCIAYYSGTAGGTAYTITYAKKQGKTVINLYK